MTEDEQAIIDTRMKEIADALTEERMPRVCMAHFEPIYHDEKVCPCCKILRENRIELTKS